MTSKRKIMISLIFVIFLIGAIFFTENLSGLEKKQGKINECTGYCSNSICETGEDGVPNINCACAEDCLFKKKINPESKNPSECPEKCTCSGSAIKCNITWEREMTITSGKSENVIVQVKGENMSTNITLYKADEKIYGLFKNNETKQIKMMPDQAKEKIQEKLQQKLEKYTLYLKENGIYQFQTEKKARLFYLFPVKEKTQLELNSTNGQLVSIRNPWWGFLAKDNREQTILNSNCGTIKYGYKNECCQSKGYDFWNVTSLECEFGAIRKTNMTIGMKLLEIANSPCKRLS